MYQVKTKDNVRFEEPLNELLSIRITVSEMVQLDTTAKSNFMTVSELVRNLIRENVHKYAGSENLIKYLMISNKIDRVLLENRLISSRKVTNLSKIREILTDFETFLEGHPKRIDVVELQNRRLQLDELLKIIYENDDWLSLQIDGQVRRIYKNKHFKGISV